MKWLKRRKAETEAKTEIKFVKEIAGVKFYEYENIFEVPANRFLVAQHAVFMHEIWKMSSETATELLDKQFQALMNQDIQEAGRISMLMKKAIELEVTMDALKELATYYFLVDGENPEEYDKEPQRVKKRIWEDHPVEADFFIGRLLSNLNSAADTSEIDTQLASVKNNPDHQLFDSLLRQMRTQSSSEASTKPVS